MNKLPSSARQQRERLLDALTKTPITTLKAREDLDVFHPAARIYELRKRGFNIQTHRRTVDTARGTHSKVAEYVLFNGASS